ncbi:glycosyltransferase family 4 protein [Caulobacter sp. S45]|uniref:glycosyltransferase family 4 protein n=1 Tax=Caulobacter sp. S45 TaxID=1641861 RepID=UPI0015776576|nr:glycosyltransferase family 4 protein [Caulobacter sp. S45]
MTASIDGLLTGADASHAEVHVSELERLLCAPDAIGSIDRLIPRVADAWSLQFPGLNSLPRMDGAFRPLRICIATEDIVGPVRNGGIGTTYAALAELLASLGHDTTILYLKGREVETESIEHWINYYAEKGVRFVPVPNYAAADQFRTSSDRWLQAPYNMLRFLLATPMDVVHVSEWRGSAYLSLLAKRQGLAFAETLFVVKTSSPWMWNRLYGSQPLERIEDLAKVHAERQSVELADMVIGGSLHLLRWMASQGYDIPRRRTFVQPNVASFDKLSPLMSHRSLTPGQRTPIDEIVFFGRLEARKGLFIFCQAVKRLRRMGVALPPKITFMGKPGAKLTARPDQTILEYIEDETRDWPVEIQVLSEYQQYEAIDYLLGGARLAVMPSVIENSSMAIYEAAICQVPCVATAVGGNAELIDRRDWSEVLCEPNPRSLGDQLKVALERGGHIPRPSFHNEDNLEVWRDFHRSLGGGLLEWLIAPTRPLEHEEASPKVSVCLYYTGRDEALRASLESLAAQEVLPCEVRIAVDADDAAAFQRAEALAANLPFPAKVEEAFDLDAGGAFNQLAEAAVGDFLLFLWDGATLKPQAIGALGKVAASSSAKVLNYFYRVEPAGAAADGGGILKALVLGSTTDGFFRNDVTQLPLFVARQTFASLGGFTTDYRVLCHDYEFVLKAQLSGVVCETALIELGAVEPWDPEWLSRKGYDLATSQFRAIRPKLAAAPLSLRDLLLASKGLQVRGGGPRGWKRPKETEAVRQVDSLLGRLMSTTGEPSRPPASKRAKPRDGAGLMRLLDTAEAPRAVARKAPAEVPPPPWTRLEGLTGVVREGNMFGHFLGLRDDVLHGWACDFGALNRTLKVEVELDGRLTTQTADRPLSVILGQPREVRRHGFAIALPETALSKFRRAAGRHVALRVAESGLVLAELDLPARGAELAHSEVEGYCDASDNGVLYGWAWRPSQADRHVDVAVFLDGELMARLRADRYRDDLRHRGVGDGEHGFNVTLPKAVTAEGSHRIDVVVADSGLPLLRSPVYSEGRVIRILASPKKRRFML